MPADQHKTLFHRATEEIWNKGEIAAIDRFFAPDYINHNPLGGTSPDREGMRQAVRIMRTAFPDFHSTIEELIVERDLVVARVTVRGTHLGEFMGIPPTGKPVTMMAISIARVADGRIAERWNITDTLGLLRQLDAIPSPGHTS